MITSEMVKQFEPLCYKETRRYGASDDLRQIGRIAVWKGLSAYDPERSDLVCFLAVRIRQDLWRHFASLKKQARITFTPMEAVNNEGHTLHDALPDERPLPGQYVELREALRRLRPKERAVLHLRFFVGLSLAEAGAAMGRTREAVRLTEIGALNKLRKFLTK